MTPGLIRISFLRHNCNSILKDTPFLPHLQTRFRGFFHGSTRPKNTSYGQRTNILIIREIQENATNEIMTFSDLHFSWFLTSISVMAPFLSSSHFIDFQCFARIFQPFSGPPKGSRIYLCSLLNRPVRKTLWSCSGKWLSSYHEGKRNP